MKKECTCLSPAVSNVPLAHYRLSVVNPEKGLSGWAERCFAPQIQSSRGGVTGPMLVVNVHSQHSTGRALGSGGPPERANPVPFAYITYRGNAIAPPAPGDDFGPLLPTPLPSPLRERGLGSCGSP